MPSGSRAERGYTLVALAMIVAATAIFAAAVIPLWSARIRRDKEEELISRGFQYAEGIRVFLRRFGRLPNRLEELIEVEPRSIRQLWKDPMTDDGAWAVIVELPGRGLIAVDSRTGQPVAPIDLDGDGKPDRIPVQAAPEEGGTVAVGPIHGVQSMAHGEAFHSLFDKDDYGDWQFTVEGIQAAIAKPGPSGLPPRANALTIGRPFRYPPPGLALQPPRQPPGGGGLPPGGQPPGGQPPGPKPPPPGGGGGGKNG